ncbi:hypothetical protein GQR58_010805 [Nymphon striatum]|nr:hypothetical protein GQR58_010805 [Nymphon striatum]
MNSSKQRYHEIERNKLKEVIMESLETNSELQFLKYSEISDRIVKPEDEVLIGKICKIDKIQLDEVDGQLFKYLELLEVDDETRIINPNRKLLVKLMDKCAYYSHCFSDNHFIAMHKFEIECISPKDGYYSYLIKCQGNSKIMSFIRLENLSLGVVQLQWKASQIMKIPEIIPNIKCCLFGIVDCIYKHERNSVINTPKYLLKIILIDESRQKIQINAFSNNVCDYPPIKEMDILRVENSTVSSNHDKLLITILSGSDLLVFKNGINSSYVPSHTSKLPILTKNDVMRVTELRKWMQMSLPKYSTLKDINEELIIFNLYCQVVACCEYKIGKLFYMLVCDETTPAKFLQKPKFDDARSDKQLLYNNDLYYTNINKLSEIWIEGEISDYLTVKPTDFLLLRCLHLGKVIKKEDEDDMNKSNFKICMIDTSPSRNLEVLKPSSYQFDDNTQSFIGSSPLFDPSLLSISKVFGRLKFSTINEIKSHTAPYKFHLTAEVIAVFPSIKPLKYFFSYLCENCHQIYSGNKFKHVQYLKNQKFTCVKCTNLHKYDEKSCLIPKFGMKFLLEDVTGTLEVLLWDRHAVDFFNGITPEHILKDESKITIISNFIDEVYSKQEHTLNCCILSYNTENGKTYQIFDTVVI